MQEYPCGYNKNNLAVVNIGGENGREKSDWLREQLCALPEVKDVAYANDLIGGSDAYMTEGADFGDGQVSMSMIYCSWNLPQVLGLELLEGRDFNEGEFGPILFTQDLKAHGAEMEVYADEFGDGAPIVGFIKNVNITSLRKADSPVAFQVHTEKGHTMPFAYLRLTEGSDRLAATEKIQTILRDMDPTMPFEVQFYDAIGKNLYSGEERLRLAVWLFSLLAVLLSLVGIWGQVLMDVQYKRMEISGGPDAVSADGGHLLCNSGARRLAGGEVLPAAVLPPGGLHAVGVPAGTGDCGGVVFGRGSVSLSQDRPDESGGGAEGRIIAIQMKKRP